MGKKETKVETPPEPFAEEKAKREAEQMNSFIEGFKKLEEDTGVTLVVQSRLVPQITGKPQDDGGEEKPTEE